MFSTPRPHFTPGKDPVPILQEAGWAPGPVWTGGKSRPHRDSIPDRPACSSVAIPTELPGPPFMQVFTFIYLKQIMFLRYIYFCSCSVFTVCATCNVISHFKYNNNNNIYLLQLGCYPVAVVILHVYKT